MSQHRHDPIKQRVETRKIDLTRIRLDHRFGKHLLTVLSLRIELDAVRCGRASSS